MYVNILYGDVHVKTMYIYIYIYTHYIIHIIITFTVSTSASPANLAASRVQCPIQHQNMSYSGYFSRVTIQEFEQSAVK